jgi:ppGpp synthetase/RelA/SpoT-type nucleotidyltranferase
MRLSSVLRKAISEEVTPHFLDEESFPIGTIRKWKKGAVVKVGENPIKWISDSPKARKLAKKKETQLKLDSTLQVFKKALGAGEVEVTGGKGKSMVPFGTPGMSFRDYVRETNDQRKAHQKRLNGLMGELGEMAPEGGEVRGRIKTKESILGKMIRKPDEYKRPSDLDDITGTQIIANSIKDVNEAISNVKKRYKVVEEEDLIKKPRGDYRSVHFVIEDDDGQRKELQVRTRNQDTFANWSHNVYKPFNKVQEKALRENKEEIKMFSKRMSDFFFADDMGKNPPPPPRPKCSKAISMSFGCI